MSIKDFFNQVPLDQTWVATPHYVGKDGLDCFFTPMWTMSPEFYGTSLSDLFNRAATIAKTFVSQKIFGRAQGIPAAYSGRISLVERNAPPDTPAQQGLIIVLEENAQMMCLGDMEKSTDVYFRNLYTDLQQIHGPGVITPDDLWIIPSPQTPRLDFLASGKIPTVVVAGEKRTVINLFPLTPQEKTNGPSLLAAALNRNGKMVRGRSHGLD